MSVQPKVGRLSKVRWDWERPVNRKGFLAIGAMTAFLAACGGST
jgi:hypothetical protein